MAKGHERAAWERTALLAAIGVNPYRDTKKHKKPFTPDDFNPFCDRLPNVERKKLKISVSCLKGLCQQKRGKL